MAPKMLENIGHRLFGMCEEAGNMVVLFVESIRGASLSR